MPPLLLDSTWTLVTFRAVLAGINAFEKAVKTMTTSQRLNFERSYLCHLWNLAATARLRMDPLLPLVGDLVRVDAPSTPDTADAVTDSDAAPEAPKVRALTAEDIAQRTFTIHDVVLPLAGRGACHRNLY